MQLSKADIPEQDTSMAAWMRGRGATDRAIELADACYANDFCSSLDRLGVTEAILEARSWDSGEEYLVRNRSFAHLVAHLAAGLRVKLAWPVQRIDWQEGKGARILGPHGKVRHHRPLPGC
jgi:hypothetical protein